MFCSDSFRRTPPAPDTPMRLLRFLSGFSRTAALGDMAGATADRVIDASGRYVSPGFIDISQHEGRPPTRQDAVLEITSRKGPR